jgi:hypothetical protein
LIFVSPELGKNCEKQSSASCLGKMEGDMEEGRGARPCLG